MARVDTFTVTLLGSSEARMLTRLARQAFTDAYAESTRPDDLHAYIDANYRTSLQRSELRNPQAITLLAEKGNAPAGYAQLRPENPPAAVTVPPSLQLQRFYLLKPYWGSGAADALMQRCLAEAAGRGYRTIWLSCWEQNERALAFYRKWAFAPAGEAPFRLGADQQTDVILVRRVP